MQINENDYLFNDELTAYNKHVQEQSVRYIKKLQDECFRHNEKNLEEFQECMRDLNSNLEKMSKQQDFKIKRIYLNNQECIQKKDLNDPCRDLIWRQLHREMKVFLGNLSKMTP